MQKPTCRGQCSECLRDEGAGSKLSGTKALVAVIERLNRGSKLLCECASFFF